MAVDYKKLQHILIEREISNSQLMRMANISANIICKIKTGQYIALDKVESITDIYPAKELLKRLANLGLDSILDIILND